MISELPPLGGEDACNLIRLALAYEVSKRPLKREDIISLVLGGNPRNFRAVLAEANVRLAEDFGMQIVPLPTTSRIASTATVAGRKAATTKKEPSTQGNASYILISLDRPAIKCHRRPDRLALLTIILVMIAISNNELEEETLLEKLAILNVTNHDHFCLLSELFTEWKKQKYLITIRKSDDMNVVVYSAGPRAMLEFPPDRLAKFIVDLGSLAQPNDQSLVNRVSSALRITHND